MDEYRFAAHVYDPVVGPFLKPVHKAIVRAMRTRGCARVLDLCCGTGLLSGELERHGIEAVGVDLSPAMLRVARARHPDATFIDGDASSLFIEDDQFDGAAICFGLHEKDGDTARDIVREAVRVTRRSGPVVIADYRVPEPGQALWMGLGIRSVERLAGADHYRHFQHYLQAGGTEAFLSGMGLLGLPARTFFHGWAGLYVTIV